VVALAGAAARRQHGIEIVIARSLGDRRHKVGAGVLDQPLDLALVVALRPAALTQIGGMIWSGLQVPVSPDLATCVAMTIGTIGRA
jgi:hypothetical protein